jgi:hypothetical protein
MSLRKATIEKCRDCTYDPSSKGSWRQQVYLCAIKSCPLWTLRAKPISPIPESNLRWYGADLAKFQRLMEG